MFENRINRLLAALKAKNVDAVLIASPENRFFFSGFSGETGALLITENSRTLFVEQRFALQASMETKDFNIVNTSGGLYNSINDTILADGAKRIIFEDKFFSVSTYKFLRKNLRYEELIPAGDLLLRLRVVKDDSELSSISQAAKLADEAMGYVRNLIKVGASEKELSLKAKIKLMELCGENGALCAGVVSGVRTALPCALPGNKELAFGDIVSVDLGLKFQGYCAQICRTFFMGIADEKSRAMYECVLKANEAVRAEARPGIPCRDIDVIARNIFAAADLREGYLHGIGHGTGISPQELPGINLRSNDTLCSNMTLSVGAGCYEGGHGGVRITDTAVISPDGFESLTKFPHEMAVL